MANPRFPAIYSGVLTTVFVVTILGGFAGTRKTTFEEFYVQRINIVEPDGTLRMALSDKTRAPGLFIKGKEYPRRHGKRRPDLRRNEDKNGNVESWGHLSFDQYNQGSVFY